MNWFKFEKLIEYFWIDMVIVLCNFFIIEEIVWKCSFFINSVYVGCGGDVGWMLIIGFFCEWEKYFGEYSVIYSNVFGCINWNYYGK